MSTVKSVSAAQPLPRLTPTSAPGVQESGSSWPAHILVCADDSPWSRAALTAAKSLAQRSNASVEVLSVFAPRIPVPNVPGRKGAARCEERDRCAAAELVRSVREQERQQFDGHLPWPVHLEVGDPVQSIIEMSKFTRADLLVLGIGSEDPLLRQRGYARPVSVARYTDVPMLAAAPFMTASPREAILFLDREVLPPNLIRAALHSIEDASVLWVLLHIGTTLCGDDGVRWKNGALAGIESAIRREAAAVSRDIVVRTVARTGDPVECVLSLAREVHADLIVTPVHGAPGTIRGLVANIVDHLLLIAPCSVLVVPDV